MQDDGSMVIGEYKSIKIDVPGMCKQLGVQPNAVCPAMIVQDKNITPENCQRKCPTPTMAGHRTPNDYVHEKSLKLQADYSRISKQFSTRLKAVVKNRQLSEDEKGTSKKHKSAVKGDGPTQRSSHRSLGKVHAAWMSCMAWEHDNVVTASTVCECQ